MKTQKILIGTIVATIVMFLLGFLIFAVLIGDFMGANCDARIARPMEDFKWWSMILSNFLWALLLCIIINWKSEYTAGTGAKIGAVLGFISALGADFSYYAMTTYFGNVTIIFVDAVAMAVMFAITGTIAGLVMGKVGNSSATT